MSTWSFVVIPDPQHLATPANGWTGYYDGLRDWIIDNAATHSIEFVAGVGDIVHEYGDVPSWTNARQAIEPLFDLDVPVLIFPAGNHDTDVYDQTTRDHDTYNQYFGPDLYVERAWFGDVYEPGKAQSMYVTWHTAGHDWLAFGVEFYPRAEVLDWVVSVAAAHPTHRVAVFTHAHLYLDGYRDTWDTDPYGPGFYFTQGIDDANSGEDAWTDWYTTVPNLWGVFSGHHIASANIACRTDTADDGNTVLQVFQNWQETQYGGRGRVVLYTVDPTLGTIRHRVVRTDLDTFEDGDGYDHTHQVFTPLLSPGFYSLDGNAARVDGVDRIVYVP